MRLLAGQSSLFSLLLFLLVPARPWLFLTLSNLFQLSRFWRTTISPFWFMSDSTTFFISRRIWRFSACLVLLQGVTFSRDLGVSWMTCWTDFSKCVWHMELASLINLEPKWWGLARSSGLNDISRDLTFFVQIEGEMIETVGGILFRKPCKLLCYVLCSLMTRGLSTFLLQRNTDTLV